MDDLFSLATKPDELNDFTNIFPTLNINAKLFENKHHSIYLRPIVLYSTIAAAPARAAVMPNPSKPSTPITCHPIHRLTLLHNGIQLLVKILSLLVERIELEQSFTE